MQYFQHAINPDIFVRKINILKHYDKVIGFLAEFTNDRSICWTTAVSRSEVHSARGLLTDSTTALSDSSSDPSQSGLSIGKFHFHPSLYFLIEEYFVCRF